MDIKIDTSKDTILEAFDLSKERQEEIVTVLEEQCKKHDNILELVQKGIDIATDSKELAHIMLAIGSYMKHIQSTNF